MGLGWTADTVAVGQKGRVGQNATFFFNLTEKGLASVYSRYTCSMMAARMPRKEVFSAFRKYCFESGLDIFTPFSVRTYNKAVPEPYRVHTFDRADGDCVGILLGNTCHAWEFFISSVACNEGFLAVPNPFDTWMTQIVTAAVAVARQDLEPEGVQMELRFAYDTAPGRIIALQRLCHEIGFGHYNPSQGLVVHPVLGPWFALRAVILLDMSPDDPAFDEPIPFSTELDACVTEAIDTYYQKPSLQRPLARSPCDDNGCNDVHKVRATRLTKHDF